MKLVLEQWFSTWWVWGELFCLPGIFSYGWRHFGHHRLEWGRVVATCVWWIRARGVAKPPTAQEVRLRAETEELCHSTWPIKALLIDFPFLPQSPPWLGEELGINLRSVR